MQSCHILLICVIFQQQKVRLGCFNCGITDACTLYIVHTGQVSIRLKLERYNSRIDYPALLVYML